MEPQLKEQLTGLNGKLDELNNMKQVLGQKVSDMGDKARGDIAKMTQEITDVTSKLQENAQKIDFYKAKTAEVETYIRKINNAKPAALENEKVLLEKKLVEANAVVEALAKSAADVSQETNALQAQLQAQTGGWSL